MNLINSSKQHSHIDEKILRHNPPPLKHSIENERRILKIVLLAYLHQIFCELFEYEMRESQDNLSKECYKMDNKIMQLLIQGIIETGEYTLEGIAYHTNIPLDIIYDIACGINNQFSITPWIKIVNLYMQVKPNIAIALNDKLLKIQNKNDAAFSLLLGEKQ